jgi:hypothetical protein
MDGEAKAKDASRKRSRASDYVLALVFEQVGECECIANRDWPSPAACSTLGRLTACHASSRASF